MLTPSIRELAWALLVLWAVTLISAFAFGKYNEDHTRHDIRPLLMVTSALLVVMAALFWWGGARDTLLAGFSLMVSLGMFASFIGDMILAEYIRTPKPVIFGIIAFGIAHGFYIAGFLIAGAAVGVAGDIVQAAVVMAAVTVAVILWAAFVRSPETPRMLNVAVLIYLGLIATMTGLAVWLALGQPRLWPLALGAILFLASDTILGNQIFRKNSWFLVSDVVWMLYICGQALIVWSNAVARSL
ncbi:MAG: lysoplasmalogenase [Chloroflexi bacterium]|nr:lysoplasmalogenase [Chloroflexota bacterium]MBI3761705.1 lysoplasmalogenase [Chloroflexota bacterium]